MVQSDLEPWIVGLILGVVSALSFPLGAALGLIRPLGENSLSILLSFGGGALIFALSIELFGDEYEATKESPFRQEALACMTVLGVLGAVSFVMLNSCIGESVEETHEGSQVSTVHRSTRVRIHPRRDSHGLLDQAHTRSDKVLPAAVVNPRQSLLARVAGGETALSMWMGVMLDGIPESMVFGFQAIDGNWSPSLILGVFLSNFPEAVSAAAMMRSAGKSNLYIVGLWFSLVVVTGGGAILTVLIFQGGASDSMEATVASAATKGLAGGAMLAMVASTMLPEAFHKGGQTIVSIMTVLGFIASFALKAFSD
jgi:zinc transporter ZupT